MKKAIKWLKEELSYALKIQREKSLQEDKFWKGRIYTLKRCIRQLIKKDKIEKEEN